jgi:hypothetical protein
MKSVMNLKTLNRALIDKLFDIDIRTEEDLVKCNSVDVYIKLEKRYKDISLHMLWILEQAISEAKHKLNTVNNS